MWYLPCMLVPSVMDVVKTNRRQLQGVKLANVGWVKVLVRKAKQGLVAAVGPPSLATFDCNGCLFKNIVLNETKQEFRSCVKVEVDVLGAPALIVLYSLCGPTATLILNLNTKQRWPPAFWNKIKTHKRFPPKCWFEPFHCYDVSWKWALKHKVWNP